VTTRAWREAEPPLTGTGFYYLNVKLFRQHRRGCWGKKPEAAEAESAGGDDQDCV